MADSLAPSAPIAFPLVLEDAALSFLLTLVHATTLFGAESARLFATTEAEQAAHWRRGRALLQAQGWLRPAGESGSEWLDPYLLELITALANPVIALISNWGPVGAVAEGVSHYVSLYHTLEMATLPDRYLLSELEGPTTAVARLAAAFELPGRAAAQEVVVTAAEAAQLKEGSASPALLVAAGLEQEAAQRLAQTLHHPAVVATLYLFRLNLGRPIARQILAVLRDAGPGAWLMSAGPQGSVRYRALDQGTFAAYLLEQIAALRAPHPEPWADRNEGG